MSAEVRKVERSTLETGVAGGERVDVFYELGAELEGVWVPFVSVHENRISDFAARQEAEGATKATKKNGPRTPASA